jgi:arsenite methyltransferase
MVMGGRNDDLRERVRQRYATAATTVTAGRGVASCGGEADGEFGSCCTTSSVEVDDRFGSALYSADDRGSLPVQAVAASLGCGNPTAVAELVAGETVLDLGSGGGIDILLAARRVGPSGYAYGVDMTDEMLQLARANAEKAGAGNVSFVKGTIEDVPLPDETVDVVISNCVINLSVDKPKVITEMFRLLRPGGRIGISDVVAEDHLTAEQRAERGSYVGCIAGALSRGEYLDLLTRAGFVGSTVRFTQQAADGMYNAIIQATKPRAVNATNTPPASSQTTDAALAASQPNQSTAACCDPAAATGCCSADAVSDCCGDTSGGLPATCGCH